VPKKQQALIVNISSAAGAGYVFDVAYGVGKMGVDRLTADTAMELKEHGVTVVSIYPGAVATEVVKKGIESGNSTMTDGGLFDQMESVEFSGRGVVALAADPNKMRFTGKVLLTPELAEIYGFKDVDGAVPWGKDDFLKMIRKMMGGPPSQWRLPKAKKPVAKL
jgi:dehydrogenase/reductase SDR family protein 1